MKIVYVQIRNFRGIKSLDWAPGPHVNCLIGPGDSAKTTILDAIELALNPRSYALADDSDFFNLDISQPVRITVTLAGLPSAFTAEDRYGLHLRGWKKTSSTLEDEPGDGLEEALSVRVTIDKSLEARWSIFNDRIGDASEEPPGIRFKDAKLLATTRLGPYAERHLAWGRQSVLTRIGEGTESINFQLAEAGRAAREAFRKQGQGIFKETVKRAEKLGKLFSVPVRENYAAELDVQGVSITTGGIALHDARLPLRRLGTGSSRLIVSALQHDAGGAHIALIDEVEHGLEPHRISRLLKYLKSPATDEENPGSQIFMTTHSVVVIRELDATDIFAVRSKDDMTEVRSVAATAKDINIAQRHLRGCPDAFLARKVAIGEGRTEHGLLRGLDTWWSAQGSDSFALQGAAPIDGGGNSKAPVIAEHLLDLGYQIFLLLDTDVPLDTAQLEVIKAKGGSIATWPDACSTEERIFLDVPWKTVSALIKLAEEFCGADSVRAHINNACQKESLQQITDLSFPNAFDTSAFRRAVGSAAKNGAWFKDVTRAERVGETIAPCLDQIAAKPLASAIADLRQWIDA